MIDDELLMNARTYLDNEKGDPTADARTQEAYRLITLLVDQVEDLQNQVTEYLWSRK